MARNFAPSNYCERKMDRRTMEYREAMEDLRRQAQRDLERRALGKTLKVSSDVHDRLLAIQQEQQFSSMDLVIRFLLAKAGRS